MTKVLIFVFLSFFSGVYSSADDLGESFDQWLLAETSAQEAISKQTEKLEKESTNSENSVSEDDEQDENTDVVEHDLSDPDIAEDSEDDSEEDADELAESPFDPDKDLEIETHSATSADPGDIPVPLSEFTQDMNANDSAKLPIAPKIPVAAIATKVSKNNKPKKDRKVASVKSQKSGLRKISKNCNMRSTPSSKGKKLGSVPPGRKLWTDPQKGGWFKVYRKKGIAFLSPSCF